MSKIVCFLSNQGQDPTECAIPVDALQKVGHTVVFATEDGKPGAADERMLNGLLSKMLGASAEAKSAYNKLITTESWQKPLSWSSPSFNVDEFDGVLLPGGHDKPIRKYLESKSLQAILASYYPKTKRTASQPKVIAAICHGVLPLARAKGPDGKSVLYESKTTTLPVFLERAAYFSTAPFLGDYYRTYEAYTADEVQACLKDPAKQYTAGSSGPHVVVDDDHFYVSARFPGDIKPFSDTIIDLLAQAKAHK